MKVAIVCDWLAGTGGAERVVLQLHRLFPDATIYTSQYNSDPKVWYGDNWFADADVRTTWLQRLPKALRKFLPPLRAWTFSRLDLSQYDLVISSSGAEAKGVKTASNTVHVCYCHAPTHYYWSRYEQYMVRPGFGLLDPIARLGLKTLIGPMRRWDFRAAQRPDFMIANSNYIKSEIKKYYGRDAKVIYPPVDIDRFKSKEKSQRHGLLVAGRQTPYKRFDLAVETCTQLGVPLTVIGRGPDHQRLVKLAGSRVSFLTNVSDSVMPRYFRRAEAFIFPGVDDFGVVAIEAMAAGTPVIAYGQGGALDFIKPRKNGVFFKRQQASDLAAAISELAGIRLDSAQIARSVSKFSPQKFDQKFRAFIKTLKLPK